jgi:thymidine phosphorylase
MDTPHLGHDAAHLRAKRVGIDTYLEPVAYMHADCPVCRSEGFEAQTRVKLTSGSTSIIATLNVVRSALVSIDQAGLSEAAWRSLGVRDGDFVEVSHPEPLESFSSVRGKIYGRAMSDADFGNVIHDVVSGRLSNIEIAAFITACAGDRLSLVETVSLTRAMVAAGERLAWNKEVVVDKHSVGGLPGNRTTPIVVAIVCAAGLTMPKTSSRAITSPAGTADTMETLAPVDLDLGAMRRVVEKEGGCIVWGGAMGLSPADDVLIRVERPLDFDSDGQLAASILSKKIAAGSTHVVIDMPVGPTAKLRTSLAAERLSTRLKDVGQAFGLTVWPIQTDGLQPVGRGIGPALEARDVVAVLTQDARAPHDLRDRAVLLAGRILEMAGHAPQGAGASSARDVLSSGAAWSKFQAICEAQGGLRTPSVAEHRRDYMSNAVGRVESIDNRKLARIAKFAGAPVTAAAGIELHARLGQEIVRGQPLFTLHAETPGEFEYAWSYAERHAGAITMAPL